MIVPMYKYSFVVYHREFDEFINNIASLGVLDISVNRDDIDDHIKNKMILNAQLTDIIRVLSNRKVPPVEATVQKEGADVVVEVKDIQARIEKLQHQVSLFKKEIVLAEPWGDYSTELIQKIHDEGYTVRFFITPERRFTAELEENPSVLVVNRIQNNVYFIAIQAKGTELSIDADEIKVPALSPSQMRDSLKDTELEIVEANRQLDDIAAQYIPTLDYSRKRIIEEVEYQQVMLKTLHEADNKLCILTGYVPVTDDEKLEKYLNASEIIYYKVRPVPDDNPPILLRNGWFARLFEPISEIFSMPNYKEMDLTPFFAPFFMMFFGFCMGDLAYGIILVLAGVVLRNRVSPS